MMENLYSTSSELITAMTAGRERLRVLVACLAPPTTVVKQNIAQRGPKQAIVLPSVFLHDALTHVPV